MRTHLNFTRVNNIETMYERSRENVKVEPRSTFTFYAWPFIHYLYVIYARKFYVRSHGKITQQSQLSTTIKLNSVQQSKTENKSNWNRGYRIEQLHVHISTFRRSPRARLFCICARVGYLPGLECSTEEHGIDATIRLRSTVYKEHNSI